MKNRITAAIAGFLMVLGSLFVGSVVVAPAANAATASTCNVSSVATRYVVLQDFGGDRVRMYPGTCAANYKSVVLTNGKCAWIYTVYANRQHYCASNPGTKLFNIPASGTFYVNPTN